MLTYHWIKFFIDDNDCLHSTNAARKCLMLRQLLTYRQICLTWRYLAVKEVSSTLPVPIYQFLQTDEAEPALAFAATYVLIPAKVLNHMAAFRTSAKARTFFAVGDLLCWTSSQDFDSFVLCSLTLGFTGAGLWAVGLCCNLWRGVVRVLCWTLLRSTIKSYIDLASLIICIGSAMKIFHTKAQSRSWMID